MISEASRALKAVAKAEGWMAVVPEETPELGAVMARAILAMEEGGAVVAGEAETASEVPTAMAAVAKVETMPVVVRAAVVARATSRHWQGHIEPAGGPRG